MNCESSKHGSVEDGGHPKERALKGDGSGREKRGGGQGSPHLADFSRFTTGSLGLGAVRLGHA